MGYEGKGGARRRPTNISVDEDLLAEAKSLGLNVSRACEVGLRGQVQAEKERQWLTENAAGIAASNAYVAEHGLPLAHLRLF